MPENSASFWERALPGPLVSRPARNWSKNGTKSCANKIQRFTRSDAETLGITEENKASFYSQYYDRRFARNYEDGYNELENLMEAAKPKLGYVVLSDLMEKTNHQVVITTNFDHLLEDAINYYTSTIPLVIGHEALAHYAARKITRPTILKIHRDLLTDPKSEERKIEVLDEKWVPALEYIFSNYCPIFLGYAGNDKSLMDFLLNHSEKFRGGTWGCPYWLLYKNDKLNPDSQVEHFLKNANGYCVQHDGFDDVMLKLGRGLFDYKLCSEDEFLKEARGRFQEIKDTFDTLTGATLFSSETSGRLKEPADTLQAVQEAASQVDSSRLYAQAVNLFQQKDYESARNLFQQLVNLEPNHAKYRHSLAVTLHEMKQYEEALVEKRKAAELEPENAGYYHSLASTLHALKRYNEAVLEQCKALELEPDNACYHDGLGRTLETMTRFEGAKTQYQKAVTLEPGNVNYQHDLTRILDRLKE